MTTPEEYIRKLKERIVEGNRLEDLRAGQTLIAEGRLRMATPEECKKIQNFVKPPLNINYKKDMSR